MEESMCCMCLNNENKYGCVFCDFCKEGIICCDCLDDYEEYNNMFLLKCPCCKSLLINHSIRNIIVMELFNIQDIFNKQLNNKQLNLYNKWNQNFINANQFG